jgi:hypothetical protein
MRTLLIVLGSALALAVVAVFGRVPRAEPAAAAAPAQSDELKAELRQLRAQTAALSAEVAALRRQPAQLQALGTAVASKGEQPSAVPAAASEEELEAQRARDEQQQRERLDAELSREQPDRSWEDAAALPDRLRGALPDGSAIVSIDCGSSLCRVITSHPDLESYQRFQQRAFMRADPENPTLWRGAAAFMRLDSPADEPTSVRASAYLSRNEALPGPAAPAQ